MKNLEQIQEENRKSIILANNPEAKDYEEALEMELDIGCIIARHDIGNWGHLASELYYRITNLVKTKEYKNYDFILTCCGFQKFGCGWLGDKNEQIRVNKKKIIEELICQSPDHRGQARTKIIGKPLTLDRVLIALEPYPNNWGIVAGHIAKINRKACSYDFKCEWDLTKPTLEEQTEETQRAINKLLTK